MTSVTQAFSVAFDRMHQRVTAVSRIAFCFLISLAAIPAMAGPTLTRTESQILDVIYAVSAAARCGSYDPSWSYVRQRLTAAEPHVDLQNTFDRYMDDITTRIAVEDKVDEGIYKRFGGDEKKFCASELAIERKKKGEDTFKKAEKEFKVDIRFRQKAPMTPDYFSNSAMITLAEGRVLAELCDNVRLDEEGEKKQLEVISANQNRKPAQFLDAAKFYPAFLNDQKLLATLALDLRNERLNDGLPMEKYCSAKSLRYHNVRVVK